MPPQQHRNLRLVQIDLDHDLLLVRGPVPGPNGAYIMIRKAKKAIKQAFENQIHGHGLSLVELLSSCPTNWDIPPAEALHWIETQMETIKQVGLENYLAEQIKKDE